MTQRVSDVIHNAVADARRKEERREELLAAARALRFGWATGVETLFKFRSLSGDAREYTLDILRNSRIYFSSPEQFNDPFDCAPPFILAGDIHDPQFFEELKRDEEQSAKESGLTDSELENLRIREGVPIEQMAETARKNTLRALQRDTRIVCFATEQCHPLTWSHYASSHTGICLHFKCEPGTLFGLARKVLYHQQRKSIQLPLYRQGEDEITERLVFEKADFWEYESEYRIVGHQSADWGYHFDDDYRVAFSPESVSGVTLGMRISDSDKAAIVDLAKARPFSIPIWEAVEDPDRYWMQIRPVR